MDTEMNYKEREADKKIDLLIQQIGILQDSIVRIELKQQEMDIRQKDITMPALLELKKSLHGNGSPGLLKEHALCQAQMQRYDKYADKLLAVFIAIILQATGMIFLYFKR